MISLFEKELNEDCDVNYNPRRDQRREMTDTSAHKRLKGQTRTYPPPAHPAASCVKMLLEQRLPAASAPPPSSGSNLYVRVLTVGRSPPSGLV